MDRIASGDGAAPCAGHPAPGRAAGRAPTISCDVLVVGGGCAGVAVAAGLRRRRPDCSIVMVEPRAEHHYQPGWTLVGAGVLDVRRTVRPQAALLPDGVTWIRNTATAFEPEHATVVLQGGDRIRYRVLVVCTGIKLDWTAIEGLAETLGRNGVTSNYRIDTAPYTWALVRALRGGRALFTQPEMPIKCAGAPQKALYLSCSTWERRGVLDAIDVRFHNANAVLFGVPDYVPSLEGYVRRYGARITFQSVLRKVDGPARKAWFEVRGDGGAVSLREESFDLLHVTPPQTTPDAVRASPLVNAAGWVEVDHHTLQHTRYGTIFGLGDACSAPNAKTAAAVRRQAPVVVLNVLSVLDGRSPCAVYDGYGSCPLTVEHGKVVLAEFGYNGKLMPSLPWDSTKPRRSAWIAKTRLFPHLYWNAMLRGRNTFP
ncbi:NAD(P)/FAD-dependent oxidoreductase [Azospirillum thermophilum]|uniref:Pyridine nucleotide-disulfide oxidoreductase n=1 Tax=Azospirillum thermophilum TaxID=2202148 RepID=A0A2S2CV89_9PROT|nr:FAD/NAD(P)-binding oxidoreductase [Azospirillum thermophilum]AWK88197.1 pyridine nucleotide-disulfide oxidoreductase [Azospirillum thermophilum]